MKVLERGVPTGPKWKEFPYRCEGCGSIVEFGPRDHVHEILNDDPWRLLTVCPVCEDASFFNQLLPGFWDMIKATFSR